MEAACLFCFSSAGSLLTVTVLFKIVIGIVLISWTEQRQKLNWYGDSPPAQGHFISVFIKSFFLSDFVLWRTVQPKQYRGGVDYSCNQFIFSTALSWEASGINIFETLRERFMKFIWTHYERHNQDCLKLVAAEKVFTCNVYSMQTFMSSRWWYDYRVGHLRIKALFIDNTTTYSLSFGLFFLPSLNADGGCVVQVLFVWQHLEVPQFPPNHIVINVYNL